MYKRIIRNDIKNSKVISIATLLIITTASVLVSLAVILGVNLFGAIDTLMTNGKTPHFLQMHSGDIDLDRLNNFAESNELVDKYQVLEFLNIDGAEFIINGKSLSDSVEDHGLSVQSEEFDYLIDLDGKIAKPSLGEIYLPIYCKKERLAQVGDTVSICDKEFKVAGFFRDSQMNSSLASSKRYLVSQEDYEDLRNSGSVEYLIEFRLKNIDDLGIFENEYISAGLEANGPTITYPLFKMINAISEGIMIGIILISSIIILAISFMCIRFTLLAKIEEDYSEIGVMKAIGLPLSDIKKIYLAKYTAIAAIGSLLGYIISFPLKKMLLENIRLNMGESKNAGVAPIFSIIGVSLVFLIIVLYVNKVLKRFKKISVVEALRNSSSSDKEASLKKFSVNISRITGANVFLGIKDVLSRKKLYSTMFIIFVLVTFIIIVPQNLYNTISAKDFVTYMGIGNSDLRIDIQQTDNIEDKSIEICKAMSNDENINKYTVSYTKTFTTIKEDGTSEKIKVDLGDPSVFPITYFKGRAPKAENEIAISSINSDELEKKVGDTLVLNVDGVEKKFKVSGIYSDITNGGKTAKATFTSNLDNIMWCTITANLIDTSKIKSEVKKYEEEYSFAKVNDSEEYLNQTFGSTKDSIKMACIAAIVASLVIVVIITALFMKMLISKDKYTIAVMKSLGFNNSDISVQYVTRAIFTLIIGTIIGIILASTLGEILAGIVISSFGADSFKFIVNPVVSYVLCPIMLICTVAIVAIISTAKAGKIKISENIKE